MCYNKDNKERKRYEKMKKILYAVIAIVLLVAVIFGIGKVATVNKNRYYVEAYCEQDGGELLFTFHGNTFAWELGAGDRIPKESIVVLVMDNNGTEGFLEDDMIVKYQ